MIGLKSGTVRLDDHRKEWEEEAQRTITLLKNILGPIIKDIQHIGSTSIYSIKAKPIIDIAIAVDDFDSVLQHEAQLKESGFHYRPKSNLNDQILFACGSHYDGTGDIQTHYIHIFHTNSKSYQNAINFRDYLNKNISDAKKYENLKMKLADESKNCTNRENYIKGKHDFITSINRKAFMSTFLGKKIKIKIDRKIGTFHPKFNDIYCTVNYGYIPNVFADDGEEQDAYLLGVDHPVDEFEGKVIGFIHRLNDVEDKLVVAPEGVVFTKDEIKEAVNFQEKFFNFEIEIINSNVI